MNRVLGTRGRWVLRATCLALVAGMWPSAAAQAAVATYVLEDVWLLPDISHPGQPAQPMTGTFEWTYEAGDFENGSGEFVELSLPWWSDSLPPLAWTIEASALEITMPGKYHDLGVDVTLRFLEPLSPDLPSTIDTVMSAFEIQVGVARMGHVISGSVVPVLDDCPADIDGDGDAGFADLLAILSAWGPCGGCAADIDANGEVGFSDLLILLGAWGPCV